MQLILRTILLGCCCFLMATTVQAQVSLSLSVSPSIISKDEYATLKIIIENSNEIEEVTPPSLKKFIVLSGPNQENSMSSVNGRVKKYAALVFIIKPRQTGKISIDAATVKIGGKVYKTNAATLTVNNTASKNNQSGASQGFLFPNTDPYAADRPPSEFNDYIFNKGDNVSEKVNKNMLLKLEVNKTSCFVGEPVVATYKLYTRLKSESKLTENPSFNGFSVIDLTRQDITGYTREKMNGREYNVYTIRKAQLYPLQPGSIELEPAELENNIQFIKAEYLNRPGHDVSDLFDDFTQASIPPEGIINQNVSLKSKPVMITVKELPEVNKPASFTGAVGNFSLEAGLQKSNFPSTEPGKLMLKISGSGNLQLLTAPALEFPAGIDAFEPKVSESITKLLVPVSGYKLFEYSFSADVPGDYILPAIHFSYFDPATSSYKTITTKPFSFTVTKPTGAPFIDEASQIKKEPVTGINRIFDNRWWIIAFLGTIVLTGLIFWIRKEKKQAAATVEKPAQQDKDTEMNHFVETAVINQQNPLLKTEDCLNKEDCTDFYTLLNAELKNFLSTKFDVPVMDINTRSIAGKMDKKGISNETVLQMQQLLGNIEWQLYTPFERNEKLHAVYQEAQDLVQLINTYDYIRHP